MKARGVNLDTKTLRYGEPDAKQEEAKEQKGIIAKIKRLRRNKKNNNKNKE